jgi:hypothetical protein
MLAMPAMAQFVGPVDPDANSIIPSSQSIRSETSFDLFENHWDYMLMPGYLGLFEDDGRYYTQLANLGERDMFQFGMYRPLGPGYIAFKVQFMRNDGDFTESTVYTDFELQSATDFFADPDRQFYDNGSDYENNAGDVYVGYAWPLAEDSSLGFGIDYVWQKSEYNQFESELDVPRDGTTNSRTLFTPFGSIGGVNYWQYEDNYYSSDEFDAKDTAFIVEYMKRGDISWRVRGVVQAVDHDSTYSETYTEDWTLPDDNLPDYFLAADTALDFKSVNAMGESTEPYTDSYDGTRFGLEGDVRFEKNPELNHQVNLGFYTASLDPKDDEFYDDYMWNTVADVIDVDPTDPFGGPGTTLETLSGTYEELNSGTLDSSDITADDWFLTWKTRWHLGDTHIGAGAYYFYNKMEWEASGPQTYLETYYVEDTSGILGGQAYTELGTFSYNSEYKHTSFSIPVALEQDIGERLTLRLGSQWRYDKWDSTDEYMDTYNGEVYQDLDPDNPDPVVTFLGNNTVTDTYSSESSETGVWYNAGLAYEFDRVTLELMFSGSTADARDYPSNSYREPVSFDQIFIGATFKVGER